MLRSTAFASLAILAAFAATPPAAWAEDGNVVGGGVATITGGDNAAITYSAGGAGAGGGLRTQAGRLARVTGGGDGMQVEYLEEAPAGAGMGREAWMVGGGDGAEVVYSSPHRRR